MSEARYKIDTKNKLTKVAEDLQKVLGVRKPTKKPEEKPAA